MITRLLKEFRGLLPVWGGVCCLALMPWWLGREAGPLLAVAVMLGILLLSTVVIGQELQSHMFALQLVQPISRRRLWLEKLLVLGSAVMTILLALVWALSDAAPSKPDPEEVRLMLTMVMVGAVAAVGGGLCLTLLLRQTTAAFWFGILLPALLPLLLPALIDKARGYPLSDETIVALWIVVPLVYGLAAFALAWRQFLEADDRDRFNSELEWPLKGMWSRRDSTVVEVGRSPSPWRTLLAKELRLQQINYLLALAFALLLSAVFILELSSREGHQRQLPDLLMLFWFFGWTLLPLMVGATALAEERRLGTLESQLTLPVARGRPWLAKIAACYGISFVLGVIAPLSLELLAWGVWGDLLTRIDFAGSRPQDLAFAHGLAWLTLTTFGLWGSSLSRSLTQALSLLCIVAAGSLALTPFLAMSFPDHDYVVSPKAIFLLCAGLVFLPGLVWLTRRNYAVLVPGWRQGIWNLGVLAVFGVTASVAALAAYNRVWEVLIPEPRPDRGRAEAVARLGEPRILSRWGRLMILPGDGSIWGWGVADPPWQRSETSENPDLPTPRHWMQPTLLSRERQWRDAGLTMSEQVYAIKPDGSLWTWFCWASDTTNTLDLGLLRRYGLTVTADGALSQGAAEGPGGWGTTVFVPAQTNAAGELVRDAAPTPPRAAASTNMHRYGLAPNPNTRLALPNVPSATRPQRVTSGYDWQTLAVGANHVLGIKTNGTLWAWGTNRFGQLGLGTKSNQDQPVQVGQDSDWTTAFAGETTSWAIKQDGSVWWWGRIAQSTAPVCQLPGPGWERITGSNPVAIDQDGIFCPLVLTSLLLDTQERAPVRSVYPWQSVALSNQGPDPEPGVPESLAIRTDGTLWRGVWSNFDVRSDAAPPRQIGSRTDWVAVASQDQELAMTADGWFWVAGESPGSLSQRRLLPPSRLMKRVANLLQPD
jgi:hypothetical protein